MGKMARLKVLLTEDNSLFREVLREHLQEQFPCITVEEAVNCDEAFQKIKEISPHLIFMDMNLPEMNGLKMTQKIKKDFPHIHIAILTGYDQPEFEEAALKAGADRFFNKNSLQWEELKEFVESISSPSDVPTSPGS